MMITDKNIIGDLFVKANVWLKTLIYESSGSHIASHVKIMIFACTLFHKTDMFFGIVCLKQIFCKKTKNSVNS